MAGSDQDERLGQLEALLLESFGLHLLSFLCGVDQDEMLARLNGKLALPVAAESVLTADLSAIAQHVAAQVALQPTLPKRFSLDVLARPVGRDDESLGAVLRLSARGGLPDELPPHPAGDAIKVALRRLSVDVFPLLLAPEDPHWRMPLISMYQHPARQALQAAVQEDPRLRQLFTADDPGLGRSGYIYTSLGRGGSIQDVMFGELVIGSAWDSLTMTQDAPSLSDLIQQVEANVDALRSVAAGGQEAVAARLVFTGFTTSQSRSIVTPWGVVRRIHDWERRLAPPGLEGAVSGTDSDGKHTTVSYAGEMVLETTAPYAIQTARPDDVGAETLRRRPSIPGFNDLRRKLEGIQLALLLACERSAGSWVTARLAWQWAADLCGHGGNLSWADARVAPGFMPYELSAEECEEVEFWARLIDDQWAENLDISVRRLISAASARSDVSDRLVDAFIVWENIFGTAQGETRLRISAAMAWLLASDHAAREALQRKLRKIYDDRSKIVHGASVAEGALAEQANAAVVHARQMLRVLLRDRPDVLALPDGAARSTRMLLGG